MTAAMKRVTIDEHNEELVNFAKTINFNELFDHVKGFAKVDCTFYQPEITTNRGEVYITFMSDDIAEQTGPFAAILANCYLASFSNRVFKDNETGELCYWVNTSIRYQHKDGGSNGMDLGRAWYTENKGWIFEDVQSR